MMRSCTTTADQPLIISFCGGAGLFPLLSGAGSELLQLIQRWAPQRRLIFAGVSAGTLPAILLCLGFISPLQMKTLFRGLAMRFDGDTQPPVDELFRQWKRYLIEVLKTDNRWKDLNGRLLIGISVWNSATKEMEPRVLSRYDSEEDVADAVLTSAHLFLLGLWPVRSYKGKYAADGGLTCRYVRLPRKYGTTIPICYDSMSKEISPFDYTVDFDSAKYDRLFKLGENMVRRQQDYFLSLIWFGKHNGPQPHHSRPLAKHLDIVSLSLASAVAATAALGLGVYAVHSVVSSSGKLLLEKQKEEDERIRSSPLHSSW